MENEKTICRQRLTGERALFCSNGLHIVDTIFEDGESPLKESRDLTLEGCMFKWKYPLWYCRNVTVKNTTWFDTARAGVWYSENVSIEDAVIEAPKNFRRCRDLSLTRVTLPNAAETLWHCDGVTLREVTVRGDYFGMNCTDLTVDKLTLTGNYAFDGAKNAVIRNANLLTKDAFWNAENVTVYDSFISGEYFGWNARNLTLVRCTVESLQGFCYIDGLVMKDCKLLNTTRAFEYSAIDAEIDGAIDSVCNPSGGIIRADRIDSLTVDARYVDPAKTVIVCRDAEKKGTSA